MKLKWETKGAFHVGRDHNGWARAIVIKEATWTIIVPIGIPTHPLEEVCGYRSASEAKRAAQILVNRAISPAPKGDVNA